MAIAVEKISERILIREDGGIRELSVSKPSGKKKKSKKKNVVFFLALLLLAPFLGRKEIGKNRKRLASLNTDYNS